MKITISTNDLKEALSIAQNTLGSSSDITSHFVFVPSSNGVSVMACEPPRTFSKIPCLGATIQDFEDSVGFSIDGKRTLQAIGAVTGVLEISDESGDVTIKSDKGTLSLSSLDPNAFPPWLDKFNGAEGEKSIPSSVLYDCLNQLKAYISTDDSRRPELAMLYVNEGKAYACDGFGLCVARHEALEGVTLKLHFKDVAPLCKFLKAHDGHAITIKSGGQATFFVSENNAVFGTMDLPHTYPTAITTHNALDFDMVPRRVWRLSKGDMLTAINFLSAGADKTDLKVVFKDPEGEIGSTPVVEMRPASGKGSMSFKLEVPAYDLDNAKLEGITDPGERMFVARSKATDTEGEDIESFNFNYLYMKRAVEGIDQFIYMGCNRQQGKGYMLFKSQCSSSVEIVSVIGWMM